MKSFKIPSQDNVLQYDVFQNVSSRVDGGGGRGGWWDSQLSINPSIPSHTLRPERSENLICWDSCDQLGIYQLYLELISKICGDWSLAGGILSCPIISFISKHVFCNIGILNKSLEYYSSPQPDIRQSCECKRTRNSTLNFQNCLFDS